MCLLFVPRPLFRNSTELILKISFNCVLRRMRIKKLNELKHRNCNLKVSQTVNILFEICSKWVKYNQEIFEPWKGNEKHFQNSKYDPFPISRIYYVTWVSRIHIIIFIDISEFLKVEIEINNPVQREINLLSSFLCSLRRFQLWIQTK